MEEFDEEEDEYYDAEDDEEVYESDIDELAEVVEKVAKEKETEQKVAPTISVDTVENAPLSPAVPNPNTNYLSTLERGLAKRQSKGKYQVSIIRGVFKKINLVFTQSSGNVWKRCFGGSRQSSTNKTTYWRTTTGS